MKPQTELLRIAKDFETGEISLDTNKKVFGRGAYICRCEACLKLAVKKKALERSFKGPMQEMYSLIQSEINVLGESADEQ